MVSPERFIEMAWSLELSICSITKETTPPDYLDRCHELAVKRGISVYTLDFSKYDSPYEAFTAEENRELVQVLERCGRKTLVIFENADVLAPLDCDETFWLRSLLLGENKSQLTSVFLVNSHSTKALFYDNKSAFYMSSIPI